MLRNRVLIIVGAIVVLVGVAWLVYDRTHKPGGTQDPVDLADGRTQADFAQASADVFQLMDGHIELAGDEVKGRNNWIMWTAGDEQFWDKMSQTSYGIVDLLKTIDSRNHDTRFHDMGVVNEPGMMKADKADEFGLYVDQVDPSYQSPQNVPKSTDPAAVDPKVYGRPTGIVGLRLYPNPNFDAAAKAKWDPNRFYNDQKYFLDPTLVRPYRVGMTCGFCHVAPYPLNPPADPERPKWENLASIIGNQYLREGAVFGYD
ncbi:MAG TPA: hypothetical protein VFC46_14090, partial [Humisphaera sp.]|nr:hypothetical protein [Humisphaera sp.]